MKPFKFPNKESAEDILKSEHHNNPIIKDLLPDYVRRLGVGINNLREHFKRGEWEQLSDLGHQMKGSASQYGYPRLAVLVGRIEELTRNNREACPETELEQLIIAIKRLYTKIKKGCEIDL